MHVSRQRINHTNNVIENNYKKKGGGATCFFDTPLPPLSFRRDNAILSFESLLTCTLSPLMGWTCLAAHLTNLNVLRTTASNKRE